MAGVTLPSNQMAERAVLGACLLDGSVKRLRGHVQPADFYFAANRWIFEAMLRMGRMQTPIDFITVADELQRAKHLEAAGGHVYLASLTDGLPREINVEHYAAILRERTQRRTLIAIAQKAQEAAADESVSSDETLRMIGERVAGVTARAADGQSEGLLVNAAEFMAATATQESDIDWLVEGVIQRGANGVMVGLPKAAKSFSAVSLAISIAAGIPWLGFKIARPANVAIVSREDNPSLTAWRMRRLAAGRDLNPEEIAPALWINSRRQSKQFFLENPTLVARMVAALHKAKPELLILDVFNRLHTSDENDAAQMSRVLQVLTDIQGELGTAICLVHHFNKADANDRTLIQRVRGSSAISGWVEWLIGFSIEDNTEEPWLRKMEFELKAAASPAPVFYRIVSDDDTKTTRMVRDYVHQPVRRERWGDRRSAERKAAAATAATATPAAPAVPQQTGLAFKGRGTK